MIPRRLRWMSVSWGLFGILFWRLWLAQLTVLFVAMLALGASPGWIVLITAAFLLISVWLSAGAVLPLSRIIHKARRTQESSRSASSVDESLDEGSLQASEPSEIGDIEHALDRMSASLRRRRDELAREREELATLMRAISDAILAVDLNGDPLFFNPSFLERFGGPDFIERRPRLGEVFRAPEILDAFRGSLSQGDTRGGEVSVHPIGKPQSRDYFLSVSPLRRGDGSVYGAVGIFHDISELKRAERIRIEFVANVSHELRTPLTAIKGYSDTLSEDVERGDLESAGKLLEPLSRNVERLMLLIGDLLDLSSLESATGAGELKRTRVSTREVSERALAQVDAAAKARGVAIAIRTETETLIADPKRIEQVIVNLLENAVKYIQQGGRIEVTWEREAGAALLKVRDNGPGIPPEHLSRLFERFYRVEQARTRDAGGTGLGLAIVKHIVQRHGGTVSVRSEPGRGAEFVCRFPDERDA